MKQVPKTRAAKADDAPRNVNLGDQLKIERRYIVDGVLTCVTDQGKFRGVQVLGSSENLVIEDKKTGEARMIPLHTISEITITKAAPRPREAESAPAFDPSFA